MEVFFLQDLFNMIQLGIYAFFFILTLIYLKLNIIKKIWGKKQNFARCP